MRKINYQVLSLAQKYMQRQGLTHSFDIESFRKPDESTMRKIASNYEKMPHENPLARVKYSHFITELMSQWKIIRNHGSYKIMPWVHENQPYTDSAHMLESINKGVFYFFLTENGFGSHAEKSSRIHPLLLPSEEVLYTPHGNFPLLYNDVFRIVHDFFGHAISGYSFGPMGEFNATRSHLSMFHTKDAKLVLLTETLGQNAWVNFGPHMIRKDGSLPKQGEPDYIPLPLRNFAPQKINTLHEKYLDYAKD
jgi:hypothetical protein